MGLSQDIQEVIILSCLAILLPIVPAYILYKTLPPEKTFISGPLQGLNIQLTGSFGGYFILVVVLIAFIKFVLPSGAESYQLWDVAGKIQLPEGYSPETSDTVITMGIEPPRQQIYPSGRFIVQGVPIPKAAGADKPKLIFQQVRKGHYKKSVVHLDKEPPAFESGTGYKIEYQPDNIITIDQPVVLQTLPQTGSAEYSGGEPIRLSPE
jgi:hypothetical protein